MRRRSRLLALLVAACAALGCETVQDWTRGAPLARAAAPSHLSVELWTGFTQRPEALRSRAERVELVLDVTTSMQRTPPNGPARFVAAQHSARRLLDGLPEDTSVGLRVLGSSGGGADCSPGRTLAGADRGRTPAEVARLVGRLRPDSEASIAAALDGIRDDLAEGVTRTRVVLFTDLGAECGGDLCAAASSLVDAGARLDVVLFSDAVLPQCFASFTPGGRPDVVKLARPVPAASFRIDAHVPETEAGGPALARGRADGTPVVVPSGAATVLLEMEPPSTIGPLVLAPGTLTRVRVLDFPTLDPPVREWRWDVAPLE